MDTRDALRYRIAPLEMTPSEFCKVGRQLIERIAEFLCTLPEQGIRYSSLLPIKTEIVGARFERKSWLPVPVLIGTIGGCQRPG